MAVSTIDSSGLTSPLSATNLGTPSAINLSNATALPKAALPTGCILQVVQGTTTTAVTTTSSGSWTSTNLSASITPLSATSKILILGQHGSVRVTGSANGVSIRLVRGSTVITQFVTELLYNTSGIDVIAPFQYLDSPATTSSTTYSTEFKLLTGSSTAQINANTVPAYITLMEIAG
jgi:hypothetical protein